MRRLPAEFERQSFVQLIFPHSQSDWAPYLDEACLTFAKIAEAVARFEPCLIVCDDIERVKGYLHSMENLHFVHYLTDDTWARDCSGICVETDGKAKVCDFVFTGWGGKFEATKDNALTSFLAPHYSTPVTSFDFILEGGGIESNGEGLLLTTSECLLNPNRNGSYTRAEVEAFLAKALGTEKVLWLHHGYLAGDDTDSHIDTLARFIDKETIMYVRCEEKEDEHYGALAEMEAELKALQTSEGKPFRLIPLPMPDPIYFENERLPATYANFLIINGAVLVPTYGDPRDGKALKTFDAHFPGREIIGIDCSVLIRQHGSLHCVTMQFPEQVALKGL
jgi:agmatine deiminase